MSNKRIDLTRWRKHVTKDWNPDVRHENQDYIDDLLTLLNALERCYEELDKLPTRLELIEIFNYQKWLEYVESYFLADGLFNQDADFVRKCAVNEKYGYRIEVIDGVETVVHESEY